MAEKLKPRIPEFIETLDRIKELHIRKNKDYATSDNPFSNFDFSEYILSYFRSDRDKTFAWPISTKLARIANLLNSNNDALNESVEDSLDDIAVYAILWKCDILRRSSQERAKK